MSKHTCNHCMASFDGALIPTKTLESVIDCVDGYRRTLYEEYGNCEETDDLTALLTKLREIMK